MADPAHDSREFGPLPPVRGRLTADAPLGEVGWFRTGGRAQWLFRPADEQDLAQFMTACPADIPVTVLGVLSNTIVRDGGVPGVVIRMGREFADIEPEGANVPGILRAGAAALDVNVAVAAALHGISGLEFLSGVPGTIGGALRMNAGAYGAETKDILQEATAIDRSGQVHRVTPDALDMRYRSTSAPADWVFTSALFRGRPDTQDAIEARMAEIKLRRSTSQPIRARTGGSTFANPQAADLTAVGMDPETRSWQLINAAGCRGLSVGDAQMSEKHCNFMINNGTASATDLETLGETVRRRVLEKTGILLRWEIKRIGLETQPVDRLPELGNPEGKRTLQ